MLLSGRCHHVAASTIIDSAIAHKTLLQAKRSVWQDPFFEKLKEDITSVIKKYLGMDAGLQLIF